MVAIIVNFPHSTVSVSVTPNETVGCLVKKAAAKAKEPGSYRLKYVPHYNLGSKGQFWTIPPLFG